MIACHWWKYPAGIESSKGKNSIAENNSHFPLFWSLKPLEKFIDIYVIAYLLSFPSLD